MCGPPLPLNLSWDSRKVGWAWDASIGQSNHHQMGCEGSQEMDVKSDLVLLRSLPPAESMCPVTPSGLYCSSEDVWKQCQIFLKSHLFSYPTPPPPLLSWWPPLCRFAFPLKHCLVPCAVSVRPDWLPLSVVFLTWWLLLILLVWTAKIPLVSHGDQHGTRSVRWILKFSECNGKWCLAACCSKSQ